MRRAWWWVQVSAIGLALVVLLAWEDLVGGARASETRPTRKASKTRGRPHRRVG